MQISLESNTISIMETATAGDEQWKLPSCAGATGQIKVVGRYPVLVRCAWVCSSLHPRNLLHEPFEYEKAC